MSITVMQCTKRSYDIPHIRCIRDVGHKLPHYFPGQTRVEPRPRCPYLSIQTKDQCLDAVNHLGDHVFPGAPPDNPSGEDTYFTPKSLLEHEQDLFDKALSERTAFIADNDKAVLFLKEAAVLFLSENAERLIQHKTNIDFLQSNPDAESVFGQLLARLKL